MSEQFTIRQRDLDGSHRRELIIGDKAISYVATRHYDLRIGCSVVSMRGVTSVHTDAAHRKRGYARRLMTESIEYMKEQGYSVSVLFGISDFYHKFGYATCLAFYRLQIATRDAERAQPSLETRPATDEDIAAIRAIYNETNRCRTGSVVRGDDWGGFEARRNYQVVVTTGRNGQVNGYAVIAPTKTVVEVMEIGRQLGPAQISIFQSLLAYFAQLAIERRCGEVTVRVPPDHPFAIFSRRYGCQTTGIYPYNTDGMGRIIRLDILFEQVSSELNRRLRLFSLPTTLHLDIVTDVGEIGVSIENEQLTVGGPNGRGGRLELPQAILTQLLFGYRNIDDVIDQSDVRAHEDLLPVLRTLFPVGCPYMWEPDRF